MAGPVYSAATNPVMEKRPAPTITPIPKSTSPMGPNTRFNEVCPSAFDSAKMAAIGFLLKRPMDKKGEREKEKGEITLRDISPYIC